VNFVGIDRGDVLEVSLTMLIILSCGACYLFFGVYFLQQLL